ncbi:hypothetical protein [Poseidonibacter lekithochrous]|uniref:hypothetical protein n=1 Tax=Poseidonibacter lekithochrous TaxID=1904463 RepID=UPI0008FC5888|nr:hypothetical protein [Poseidonibacter lekithochrous]QKJ24552.1 hypothetical protein ALEK_3348 [Poseidonibacter lekithochrous]
MQVYFYAKSGHAVGLDATKRCSAVATLLKDLDPVLCTSDFRAGAYAKELFDVKKYVNIDVVRNLSNIMQRKDILIYDTDETNELMQEGMNEFCSLVFNLKEISDIIVDTSIYTKNENPSIEKSIFFGDDDYNNLFLEQMNTESKHDIDLLMGHYFFLGNEKVFKEHFNNVIDEEEYIETINNTKYLLTASVQSALESIACGNSPVIFKREDKQYNMELIEKLNIPCIENTTLDETISEFETIIKDYPTINNYEVANFDDIKVEITAKIETYKKLTNS